MHLRSPFLLQWRSPLARRRTRREMARRLATLGQLASLVSSSLDPQRVFDGVAEATSRLLDGAAALLLVADEGDRLDIRAAAGVRRPALRSQERFRPGEGLAGWVFQQRKPLVLADMLADPRTVNRAWIEAEQLRAFAGVPLLFRDRPLGVLCAMWAGGRPFRPCDVDLLAAFASHAATAIENARLYQEAEAERERLRAILESMPEAISVGEEGPIPGSVRLLLGNRVRADLLRTPELVPGARTPHYEFVRPDGTPLEDRDLPLQRAIWQGEAVRGMELAVRFPDGSLRFVLANAVPLPGPPGRRQGIAVFQDITDRKRLEERAHIEAARLQAIMDTIPEILLILDAESEAVREANRCALSLYGPDILGRRPPYLGRRLFSADGERELAAGEVPGVRACRGESLRGEQVLAELQDGRRIPYLVSAGPVRDAEGRFRLAVFIAAEITALKGAQRELERLAGENALLYEQAAREARVKGLWLDELNHRVRNNLALIVSFLELQRESPEGQRAAAMLDDAIARVRGLALVHNVLAGAGFEAGDYLALVRGLAREALVEGPLAGRVALGVEGPPLRLPSAQLTALGLITNELFTNIAKHAFPGGRTGKVEVAVQAARGAVTIRVQDDGVGLPPGFAERPGHLGLQLIRSLVEVSLKGTFALESNGGTRAVVRFPLPTELEPGGFGAAAGTGNGSG